MALIGLSIGTGSPFLEFPIVGSYDPFLLSEWSPEVYVHRVLGPLLGISMSLLIHAIVSDSVRFRDLSRRLISIDLIDLNRYAPFTKLGLSNAIIIMGFVSIFAFPVIVERYVLLVGSIVSLGIVAALLGLLLPVWGLRGRIKAEKAKEAAWCRARIPAARTALKEGKEGAGQELAGLLVYLQKVEDVNVWPLASGGIFRFALFMLIPLGSWAGGALVDRLVDSALG